MRTREGLGRARDAAGVVTPAGRAVLLLGVAGVWLSEVAGIAELGVLGWMCLAVLVLALPWVLLPSRVRAHLSLRPPRVVAGDPVVARLRATSTSRLPVWQPLVSLPAGDRPGWLRLPTLRAGRSAARDLTIETSRRGVLVVGPVVHHRGDPLGLLRTRARWADPVELYVRPVMVAVETLGQGHVRDLEGTPSDQVSMSDLAFHALREYVPGDDLRHVHWRSSARAGEVLVRQYHDSRRSHVTVLVDPAAAAYDGEQGYELAVSVAASLVACAAGEDLLVTLVSGSEEVTGLTAGAVLDGLCRVSRGAGSLAQDVARAQAVAPESSTVLVVTGARADLDEVTAALWSVPPEARTVLLRAAPGAESVPTLHEGRSVLTVGRLADLPRLMAVG